MKSESKIRKRFSNDLMTNDPMTKTNH